MKTTSINVQITKCPKQYEAVRLGMEIQLEPGDVEAEVIKAAHEELCNTYARMYPTGVMSEETAKRIANANAKPAAAPAAPAPEQKEPTRERLEFGDKRVQQIVRRMEKNPEKAEDIMAQTLKYFEPTEQVLNVLKLAAKIS